MRVATIALVLLISIASGGCVFERKKAVRVLPRPPQPALAKPAPVVAPPSDVIIPPSEPPTPPAPVVKTTEPPKEKPPEPKPEPPPQPVKRRRTPPPKQITDAPPPKPAEPEVPAATPAVTGEQPPAAPLQLREILTPERRRQYETEYGASMGRARSVIGRATGRTNLTAAQTETLNRIGTFLKQAEDSRKDDLGTAWQLARRADLLSQELLETLK